MKGRRRPFFRRWGGFTPRGLPGVARVTASAPRPMSSSTRAGWLDRPPAGAVDGADAGADAGAEAGSVVGVVGRAARRLVSFVCGRCTAGRGHNIAPTTHATTRTPAIYSLPLVTGTLQHRKLPPGHTGIKVNQSRGRAIASGPRAQCEQRATIAVGRHGPYDTRCLAR